MNGADGPQTGRKALQWAVSFLRGNGFPPDVAGMEARLLLVLVRGKELLAVMTSLDDTLPSADWDRYHTLVKRRAKKEPLQYLTGEQELMSLTFKVKPGVFIPRQETEILITQTLAFLQGKVKPAVLDLGTGSGAIAVCLARFHPGAVVCAVDRCEAALAQARENAALHGVDSGIHFLHGDMFSAVPAGQKFEAIVSNPPYISASEIEALPPDVKREPRFALFGGDDGLDYFRIIAGQAPLFLRPGGGLFLEVGWTQGRDVAKILEENKFTGIKVVKDWGQKDRVVSGMMY